MIQIDMEMPKSCYECPFNHSGIECWANWGKPIPIFFDKYSKYSDGFNYDNKEKHPRCPLKEVKE